jgi:hypothetical protein
MSGDPSARVRVDGRQEEAQPTGPVQRGTGGAPMASAGSQPGGSRLFRIAYRLVTVDLWLRTAVLAGASVALIVIAFELGVITRPTIVSFLAAQLGAGLLVGAVGAALVQAFVMSAPQTMQEMLNELRSRPREAALEDRLTELTAEVRAYELRTRATDSLAQMGVVDVLRSPEDVAAHISTVLAGPAPGDIRLLGLSLHALFGGGRHPGSPDWPDRQLSRLLLDEDSAPARRGSIHVRVLLVDPACLSLPLLAHGARGDQGLDLDHLRRETEEAAHRLDRLGKQVARRRNGNSLQVRFCRALPPFFLFATPQGMLTSSYHDSLPADPGAAGSAATWQFRSGSAAYQARCRHFDALWDTDSVPGEELLSHKAIGTDQGIGESGILNIYTSRESAQARIGWLVENARRRVWIQGVSLSHHLNPPLEKEMLGLLARSLDTRILILDPDSEQAVRKSYRDYLLDQDGDAVIDYDTYARDARLHKASQVYGRLRHSLQWFESLSAKATAGNFHVRQYACAPTSYILIADDHALVEQFHYGKPVDAEGSIEAQLQLAREMPLIEYGKPGSKLFAAQPWLNPLAVVEDHFSQVYEHFGYPLVTP